MRRILALVVLAIAIPAASQPKIRLLVVTGGHDYSTGFYTLFQGYPDVKWDHKVHGAEAEGYVKDMAAKYDVVVLYDMPKEVPEQRQGNLMEFVRAGHGIVALHHTLAGAQRWKEFHELIGGKYLEQAEGNRPASTYQHDVPMRISVVDRNHSITRGIEDFDLVDETYGGLWVSPQAHVLLTSNQPVRGTPVAWVMPPGTGRVATIQLGHGDEAFASPSYRRLVVQAIRWASQPAGKQ